MSERVRELTFDLVPPQSLVASCEIDGMVTRFVWQRGVGQIHVETGNHQPFYDWNVWSYEDGRPEMDWTLARFEDYITERLSHDEELDVVVDMRLGTFLSELV